MRLLYLYTVFLLVMFCTGPAVLYSQRANSWYFGFQSGVNFNPPSPAGLLPYAVTDAGGLSSSEGVGIMCDYDGRMMIYCNGDAVYNRDKQVMLNGDGLKGHQSAFQASVIIPMPGSASLYYVFTADAVENNVANGYTYSIVDMNGDNGRGEVISKNLPLQAPGTERLAAVQHANGNDVWIITNDHSSNVFRAWLLSCSGLSQTPVVSVTGRASPGAYNANGGCMKASPDGKKICHTHFDEGDGIPILEYMQLFDFDNSTGILSNPKIIEFFGRHMYAAEFSPDSKLLYVTNPVKPELLQLEATLPTAAAIQATAVVIPAATGFIGIQAGPDNKIYLARNGFKLSTVSNPNTKGPGCGLLLDNVTLSGICNVGLPVFINTAFNNPSGGYTSQVLDACTGRVQFTGFCNFPGIISWNWSFGDGHTSNLQNPQHIYAGPSKKYKVQLRISSSQVCGVLMVEKFITPSGIFLQPGFRIEPRCDLGYVHLVNTSVVEPPGAGTFTWFFGDGNSSSDTAPYHSYTQAGPYTITLRFATQPACLNDSITRVYNYEPVTLAVSPPLEVDEGVSVSLSATGNAVSYQWQPPDYLNSTTGPAPVTTPFNSLVYYVTARNAAGCEARDSVPVKVNLIKDIYLPEAFTPNNDGLNDVFKPVMSRTVKLIQFAVYNRWGQPVYDTRTTRNIGWNGLFNGQPAQDGAYVWQLAAIDKNGKKVVRKGTVVLVR